MFLSYRVYSWMTRSVTTTLEHSNMRLESVEYNTNLHLYNMPWCVAQKLSCKLSAVPVVDLSRKLPTADDLCDKLQTS